MTAIHRTDPGSDYAVSILCQIFLGFDRQLDQGGPAARAAGLETGLRNRCAGDIPVAGRELGWPMQYRTFGPVAGRIVKSGRSAVAEFSKLTNRAGTGSASGFLQNDQTRAQPLRTAKAGTAGAVCWLFGWAVCTAIWGQPSRSPSRCSTSSGKGKNRLAFRPLLRRRGRVFNRHRS